MKTISTVLFSVLLLCGSAFAQAVSLTKTETGFEIMTDGKPFANYVADENGTPIVWPIYGPIGIKMTRDYPMLNGTPGEPNDHPHHRSLWFNHGEVNGYDFWAFPRDTKKQGAIRQDRVVKAESSDTATLITENSWITPDKTVLCSDTRIITFGVNQYGRFIDFDIKLTAVADSVHFGDTKEGSFALRVASSMDVEAKKRDSKKEGGKITNAQGQTDDDTWGKRSAWCDYSGPVDGKTVGVTIMNHPSSFRYPTYWHVRTYGLFAANPFGEHDFENKKEKTGELTLKKGESITLKYRVLFHSGDADSLDLKKAFEEYCNSK